MAHAGIQALIRPGIKSTGCQGFCSRGPLVLIRPQGLFYQRVKPKDAKEIIERTVIGGEPVERLLYKLPETGEPVFLEKEIPFYKLQKRVVLHNIGKIDPSDINDTIAAGGYQALAKALTTMTPEQVVAEIEQSGLRGRGGAGFPAGRKWRGALKAVEKKGRPIYVVVNGDEGDPGAFMDNADCVVDVGRYFLRFLEEESCGKCFPCRLGLTRMREILDRFSRGEGSEKEIEDLMSLAQAVQDGSLCALGSSAPNPVLTTIRYFKDEYIAHVRDGKCPAGVCKELITYAIDPEACTGCTSCARQCPNHCISGEKKEAHVTDTVRASGAASAGKPVNSAQ